MFYGIRVNSALAKLGIQSTLIETAHRRGMQAIGEASGNTPQEVAVLIAAQLPEIHRLNLSGAVIRKWVEAGKVNPSREEMRNALGTLAALSVVTRPGT